MTNTTAAIGFLKVTQSLMEDKPSFRSDYDLVLAAISWEERSTFCLPNLSSKGSVVQLLRFKSSSEASQKKDEQYKKAVQILGQNHKVIELKSSLEFDENILHLKVLLQDIYTSVRRPLRVLMDVSCIPKRYLLSLIGLGFRAGFIASIEILYAEGRYSQIIPQASTQGVLTAPLYGLVSEGNWTSVQVPYMEPTEYAPRDRNLYISVGSETNFAVPLIDRMDPVSTDLIKISESEARISRDCLEREYKTREELSKRINVRETPFELMDVIGVAKHVLSNKTKPVVCLAIGSKPHAIAFGIAALANDSIEVVCRQPGGYVLGDVQPTGQIYRFHIEDRFEALAYL